MAKCKKGFKIRNGKCVKKKNIISSAIRKIHNPFKMWGSYVGLVIGLIPLIGILTQIKIIANIGGFIIKPFEFIVCKILNLCTGVEFAGLGLAIIISIVSGFLIGWVIHSLFRAKK